MIATIRHVQSLTLTVRTWKHAIPKGQESSSNQFIFRAYVSFREGTLWQTPPVLTSLGCTRFQHLNKPKIPPRQTLKQTFLGTNISLTPAQTLFKIMFLFRWDMLVSWILPQKLGSNLKMMAPRKKSLFQGFIFWFHVSFRGCNNFILVQCGPLTILNGVTTPINGLV